MNQQLYAAFVVRLNSFERRTLVFLCRKKAEKKEEDLKLCAFSFISPIRPQLTWSHCP